ncbi:MAG: hypothetical protein JXA99_06985 [Candidatus Lokiarchaeota archaeon]|nr:hypothetical protein [Candidatus Lokiarchaeota archaeon]
MYKQDDYSIKSSVNFYFKTSEIRDISFNTFLPEFNKINSKRSKLTMEKEGENNLKFYIESNDITAFRASINEIITFGKIFENIIDIIQ